MNQSHSTPPNLDILSPSRAKNPAIEVDDQLRRLCRLLEWQTLLHAGTDSGEARSQSQVTRDDIEYMRLLRSVGEVK